MPLLGAHLYRTATRHAGEAIYEFEIVDLANGKSWVELDFALVAGGRLVVGEGKVNGRLDGKTTADRERDAAKLARALAVLDADELCLVSAAQWSAATWQELAVGGVGRTGAVVTKLEDVRTRPAKPVSVPL